MGERERLPNRRRSETFSFYCGNSKFVATVGFYNDGRIGEFFLHASRSGSDRDIAMHEAAMGVSFALQYGATVGELQSAMPKTAEGVSEGVVGTLLTLLSQREKVAA